MKSIKIAVLTAALALTGCQMPVGDVVHESEVGMMKFKSGTGLVYERPRTMATAGDTPEMRALAAKEFGQMDSVIDDANARADRFYAEQEALKSCYNRGARIGLEAERRRQVALSFVGDYQEASKLKKILDEAEVKMLRKENACIKKVQNEFN